MGDNDPADLFDALTAERDAALAGAVRVRKLVWTGDCYGWRSGVYSILPSYGQGPKRFMLSYGSNIIGWFDGEEEAQAAAQADHEARVRADLEPAAPSVSAREVLLELSEKVQVIRREAAGKANGVRFQALDEVRHMIREMIDALATKENSDE